MAKQKPMLYTDEQNEALNALTQATGENYAQMVRRLIGAEAAKHGIEFPQNMPTPNDTIQEAQKKRWPKRPEAGTRVIFAQSEDEFHDERRHEVTIEEADTMASEIVGEAIQMRFNEFVRVPGVFPHTMRESSLWIEMVEEPLHKLDNPLFDLDEE